VFCRSAVKSAQRRSDSARPCAISRPVLLRSDPRRVHRDDLPGDAGRRRHPHAPTHPGFERCSPDIPGKRRRNCRGPDLARVSQLQLWRFQSYGRCGGRESGQWGRDRWVSRRRWRGCAGWLGWLRRRRRFRGNACTGRNVECGGLHCNRRSIDCRRRDRKYGRRLWRQPSSRRLHDWRRARGKWPIFRRQHRTRRLHEQRGFGRTCGVQGKRRDCWVGRNHWVGGNNRIRGDDQRGRFDGDRWSWGIEQSPAAQHQSVLEIQAR